jgi:four helix bundle protein
VGDDDGGDGRAVANSRCARRARAARAAAAATWGTSGVERITTVPLTSVTQFDALEGAYQIVAAVQPLIAAIRAHDAALAQQLSESADSIAANLAEGRRRIGRDRRYHVSVAGGSSGESLCWVRLAIAKGLIDAAAAAPALALLDREAAMTWRLTHPR